MIKAPVTLKHNGDRLCMYDANGEYLFCDFDLSTRQLNDVAQALNDGERMRVENQRLKEFLRPFARLSESIRRDRPDEYPVVIKPVKYENMNVRATVGDLRRAADALREGAGG